MYLHLIPRILHSMKNECTLVSVTVPELSLELKADSLVAMRPYPNKSYHVGMLKGRRALNGFLVKSPRTLTEFTMITIWEIDGFGKSSHTVKTLVQDKDYDLVSHDVLLAHEYHQREEDLGYRVHPSYDSLAPVDFEPTMQSRYIKKSDLSHDVWETYSWGEFLRSREETFLAMTMSSARLSHPAFIRGNRLPQTDQAIIICS